MITAEGQAGTGEGDDREQAGRLEGMAETSAPTGQMPAGASGSG
jgi:hypothetical protein